MDDQVISIDNIKLANLINFTIFFQERIKSKKNIFWQNGGGSEGTKYLNILY